MCFSRLVIREESSSASSGPRPAVPSSSRSILRGQVCLSPHQTASSLAAKRMHCLQVFGPMEIMAPPTVHSVWLRPQLPARLRCPQTCWPPVGMLMDAFPASLIVSNFSLGGSSKGICTFSFCDCRHCGTCRGGGEDRTSDSTENGSERCGLSVPAGSRTPSGVSSPSRSRRSLGKGPREGFLPKLPFEMLTLGKRHCGGTFVHSETELNPLYYFIYTLVPFLPLLMARPPLESHLFLNGSGEGTAVGSLHACSGLTLCVACFLRCPPWEPHWVLEGPCGLVWLFCCCCFVFCLVFMLPNRFVWETGVCLPCLPMKPVRFYRKCVHPGVSC